MTPPHADGIMTPKPTGVPRSAMPSGFSPDEHESLLQQYAEIGERYAPLFAAYGPGNVSERKFKSLQAAVAVGVRAAKAEASEKVTEPQIEALTNADTRVTTMLHGIEMGRLQYQQAEIELEVVKERIRRRDAVTRRGI